VSNRHWPPIMSWIMAAAGERYRFMANCSKLGIHIGKTTVAKYIAKRRTYCKAEKDCDKIYVADDVIAGT